MFFFTAIALPAVVMAVAWGLLALPSARTGWLVRADVGLAWASALVTLVLVPLDVVPVLRGAPPPPHLAVWWRGAYWYGFLAQVLVLPLHMEYTRRGEFNFASRLAGALRYQLAYYAALAGVAAAGVLLLLAAHRLAPANVLGFAIAFSNAYGLVASLFLLGFGLVAVPRALWRLADPAGQRRRLEHTAGLQATRAAAARNALSVAVLTARRVEVVLSLANSVGPEFRPSPGAQVPPDAELDYVGLEDLARLRRRIKAALKNYERERAIYIEARPMEAHLAADAADATDAARAAAAWRHRGRGAALRAAAAAAAALSLAMAAAEAAISGALPNASAVSVALRAAVAAAGAQTLGPELLCLAALAYPCACAYYSLYRLGRFAFYRLVPRHTDAYSLCFSALLVTRFAAPLAFNFMAAVVLPPSSASGGAPDVRATVFYDVFGRLMMKQPLIGLQFTTFAPALLVPYMLVLACGCFNRLSALFRRGFQVAATLAGAPPAPRLTVASSPPRPPAQFEDEFAADGHTAAGRRLLRAEADNARNVLPLGLTLEPEGGGSVGSGGADGGLAPGALLAGVRASIESGVWAADGLDGEEEGDQGGGGGGRGPWWRRLLARGSGAPSAGGHGGGGGGTPPRSAGAAAAQARLLGSVAGHRAARASWPGSLSSSPLREPLLGSEAGARGGGGGAASRHARSASTGGGCTPGSAAAGGPAAAARAARGSLGVQAPEAGEEGPRS
eukprot:scaffold2.g6959.t1